VSSIKQFVQAAEAAPGVWKIFEKPSSEVEPAGIEDPKLRSEQALRRLRRVLEDLRSRLPEILELDGSNASLKARMLVDAIVCIERCDVRQIAEREEKLRHAQLSREYYLAFDAQRQELSEDGQKLLLEVFNYPVRIAGLAEFVRLRRDCGGMEAREGGLRTRLESAKAELAEASRYHRCMEALLQAKRARKIVAVGLGCVLISLGSMESSRIMGVIFGFKAILLLIGGAVSWLAGSATLAGVAEEVRLKVSALDEAGLLAIGERLSKSEIELEGLEKRIEEHRAELNALSDRISACVEIEPTWRVMNDSELSGLMERMTSKCREVFGEKGASVIFKNLREVARL
jgi:hypothetical protein